MRTLRTILIALTIFCPPIILISQNVANPTEVLILGTTHLSQLEGFENEALSEVAKRLNNYEFDAIGIENMPTELLNDIVSRNDETYNDLIKYYGKERLSFQKRFQKLLGTTLVEAHQKIDSIIGLDVITSTDRLFLIKYYLAAGDFASAVLQYNYLDESVPSEEVHIDDKTLITLKKLSKSSNEIYSLAVKLAEIRKHQKLEYIDNLQSEELLYAYFPEFVSDYQKNQELFQHIHELPVYKKIDSLQKSGIKNNNLFPLYKFLNSSEYKKADFDAQWKIWFTTNFKSKTDLSRYALWEMRNLQISANIMRLSAFYPGKKMLIVIGSSHKYFLEKQLAQCPNIRILNFE